jgi:DNA-binding LacI/PurR family transcriptional regulator
MPGKAIAGVGSGTFPAHQAVVHRLCALGHRRIVFLIPHFVRHAFPVSKSSTISLLENGFALRGVSASSFHFPDWDETPEGLQAKLESLFRVTPPTAVFATSPVWIAGVLSFLARKGLRVPEDVSVICGHDAGSFHWNRPRIAHYEHGDKRFARRIVQWVDNISRCHKDTKFNLIPVRLIERESIGPVQRG